FLLPPFSLKLAAHSYRHRLVFKAEPRGAAMDLSKLPKMSQTPKPPEPQPSSEDPAPVSEREMAAVDAGAGGMLWFSIIVGGLCIMYGRRSFSYFLAKLSGREFHTEVNWSVGPNAGQEVAYWELMGGAAWAETGLFL